MEFIQLEKEAIAKRFEEELQAIREAAEKDRRQAAEDLEAIRRQAAEELSRFQERAATARGPSPSAGGVRRSAPGQQPGATATRPEALQSPHTARQRARSPVPPGAATARRLAKSRSPGPASPQGVWAVVGKWVELDVMEVTSEVAATPHLAWGEGEASEATASPPLGTPRSTGRKQGPWPFRMAEKESLARFEAVRIAP